MSNHKGPPVASISVTAKKGDHDYGKIVLLHDKATNTTTTSFKETATVLCTYSIPFHISIPEFLEFVAPVDSFVSHYRVICDTTPDSYLVLMKFRDPYSASTFYKQYNDRLFSSMEPEKCKVVYIEAVEIDSVTIPPYVFPFIHHLQPSETGKVVEEPTCPVCLEPMDETTTPLLTILCQHTFHCHCLSKWGDGSCPVCRYSQKPPKAPEATGTKEWIVNNTDENQCAVCQSKENLWICLICGHIGCGRYVGGHASEHYRQTSHLYALEIDTKRVWDYAGDGYVHRLIQNAVDGKLVELPSTTDEQNASQEKLEAMSIEYSYLLTSQLDSQRIYYERQMDELSAQIAKLNTQSKQAILELDKLQDEKHAIQTENHDKEIKILELTKGKKMAEDQLDEWKEKCDDTKRVLLGEKQTTNSLLEDNNKMLKSAQEHDQTIQDLNDQVRDLQFFLEAREKVQGHPELEGGSVGTHTRQQRKRRGKR